MKIVLNYEGNKIEGEIIYLQKKNISIEITSRGTFIVRSSKRFKKERILELLEGKKDWILEKILYIREKNNLVITREFKSEEIFYYLADKYVLEVICDKKLKSYLDFDNRKIVVGVETYDRELIKKQIELLYKKEAKIYISSRVEYYKEILGVQYKSITIKSAKRRWGSCTYDDKLLFNWKIMMANRDIVDYLVVHEMSHIIFKNHSKDFWNKVREILPDYKERRQWLKENGFKLEL